MQMLSQLSYRPRPLGSISAAISGSAPAAEPQQLFVGPGGREVVLALPPAAAVRDYAVSVGILIDKLRLEEGSSTGFRTESVVEPWTDDEASALAGPIRAELARRGDASGVDSTS
jgi:hypothetical protein